MSSTFQSTRWSLVLRIRSGDPAESLDALNEVCRIYWPAICRYLQTTGYPRAEAEEQTQAFFAFIIQSDFFKKAEPERGRLRSFLLQSLKHFLQNELRKETAEKRGGKVESFLTFDEETIPGVHESAPSEAVFDYFWAINLLDRSMAKLEEGYRNRDQESLYEALSPCLTACSETTPLSNVASILGESEGTLRVALHRMRRRLRELLRQEISPTLTPGDDLEEELRYLASVLASPPG